MTKYLTETRRRILELKDRYRNGWTKSELYKECKKWNIHGCSMLKKESLINALIRGKHQLEPTDVPEWMEEDLREELIEYYNP